jgi:hypothetical protein
MNAKSIAGHRRTGLWVGVVIGALLGMQLAGCGEAEEKAPAAKVEAVTAYGVTLDENATPQQVVYALLRSLAEDVQAAQAKPPRKEDQKHANLITWSLSAPGELEKRILEGQQTLNPGQPKLTALGADRDKRIYSVVNLWAPIVAYYIGSFDTDEKTAMARMKLRTARELPGVEVQYEVWPDPAKPDAERHQWLSINLVKEKSTTDPNKEYWRVTRVAFSPHAAKVTTRPATATATQPATQPGS